MMAKQTIIGNIFQFHDGLRMSGIKIGTAKSARQNPSNNPRDSSGQASNHGAFAKKPAVLHKTAARAICARPIHWLRARLSFEELAEGSLKIKLHSTVACSAELR